MGHTPTPWKLDRDGNIISAGDEDQMIVYLGFSGIGESWAGEIYEEDDAAFILKAVNSHDKLVEALKAVRAECMGYVPQCADLIDAALEGL